MYGILKNKYNLKVLLQEIKVRRSLSLEFLSYHFCSHFELSLKSDPHFTFKKFQEHWKNKKKI